MEIKHDQHLMVDSRIAKKMVELAEVSREDTVLEIVSRI